MQRGQGFPSPDSEAAAILTLVKNGVEAKAARDLIAVSPETERALRVFASRHPSEAAMVLGVLAFRARVLECFERRLAAGGNDA